jgi:subtilisin family serine protease
MKGHWRTWLIVAAASAVLPPLASAQLGGALGPVTGALPPLGQTVGRTVGGATAALDETAGAVVPRVDPRALAVDRVRRLADFVRRNASAVETDSRGDPVVRGEVLALAPSPEAEAAALAAGFTVRRKTSLGALGLAVDVLAPPAGLSAAAALERLRRADPAGAYELDHIYFPAGGEGEGGGGGDSGGRGVNARVGLVDTGVAAGLPVFQGAPIEQRGFAPGAPAPAAHGTATASLIAGRLGRFHGAAPGAKLYVADVYGSSRAGGSAESVATALDWMAARGAPVINISLVGPPNALVAAAVKALTARGVLIVAAVGNDGPAAPPAYPASYPGVVAVTGVDAHDRVLPEAGRALHVDFAAPADGFSAAGLSSGLTPVRGTSFAAPIVAGRLAALMANPSRADAESAVAALARQARSIGPAGGRGVVGDDVRLADSRAR